MDKVDNFIFMNPDDLLYEWLTKNGVSWRVYHQGSPFFKACEHLWKYMDDDHFKELSELKPDAENDALTQVTFVEPLYQDDPQLESRQATDNHPPASIWGGESFLKIVYDAVSRSPSWNETVMILTYDEHGAFFDHVKPIDAIAGIPPGAGYKIDQGFTTSGLRVPAIVISPFVTPGSVCHSQFDHTSLLKLLAEKFAPDHRTYNGFVTNRTGFENLSVILEDALLASDSLPGPPPID